MQTIQSLFFLAPIYLTMAVLGLVALYTVLGDLVATLTPSSTEEPATPATQPVRHYQSSLALVTATVIVMASVQIVPMPVIQVQGSNVPKGFGSGRL